jgi:hypothetical protein
MIGSKMNKPSGATESGKLRSGLLGYLGVFAGCSVLSALCWLPFGFLARVVTRSVDCSPTEKIASLEYSCAIKTGVIDLLLPIAVGLLMFLFRKYIAVLVVLILQKFPLTLRAFFGPCFATSFFTAFWAWTHFKAPFAVGILPQIVFPAAVGMFSYFMKERQINHMTTNRSVRSGDFRERIPRALRIGIVAVSTILLSLVLGLQRSLAAPTLTQQLIVLAGLIFTYIALPTGRLVAIDTASIDPSRIAAR